MRYFSIMKESFMLYKSQATARMLVQTASSCFLNNDNASSGSSEPTSVTASWCWADPPRALRPAAFFSFLRSRLVICFGFGCSPEPEGPVMRMPDKSSQSIASVAASTSPHASVKARQIDATETLQPGGRHSRTC